MATHNNQEFAFAGIEEALEALRNGEIIILIDDEDRENEGDFIMAAEKVTPEAINFMTKYGRGLVCIAITPERAQELQLTAMVSENTALHGTSFTVTVDAVEGTTTGISAQDRALTIQKIVDEKTHPDELGRPGHIFPLVAVRDGVMRRRGHTEAVVDLSRLAGLKPAGVLCEILDEDGSMARLPKLIEIASEFNLKIITIDDLVKYRRSRENHMKRITDVVLPTDFGEFRLYMYENLLDPTDHHLAIVKGDLSTAEPVLVRVHSECFTGDTLHSMRCDCGAQLEFALNTIEREGRGVVLYLRQEGRGIGLPNKILAYRLQDEGKDTVEANEALGFKADLREYWMAAHMLKDMGVKEIRLMTNNPRKVKELECCGIKVVERIPIVVQPNPINERYLRTKKEKMGHLLIFDSHHKS